LAGFDAGAVPRDVLAGVSAGAVAEATLCGGESVFFGFEAFLVAGKSLFV
jgi:hypothetical protein